MKNEDLIEKKARNFLSSNDRRHNGGIILDQSTYVQQNSDNKQLLIFGSSAKVKMEILNRFNIWPDITISPDIDESRLLKEKPIHLAKRLALQKSIKVLHKFLSNETRLNKRSGLNEVFILSLDSVVAVGTRVLEKSVNTDELVKNLELLSGRSHGVYTGFALLRFDFSHNDSEDKLKELLTLAESVLKDFDNLTQTKPRFQLAKINGLIKLLKHKLKLVVKHSLTRVQFKRLTLKEIDRYTENYNNGIDNNMAVYKSESYGLRFIKSINGSLSGLQGLPLYEVVNSLESMGFKLSYGS